MKNYKLVMIILLLVGLTSCNKDKKYINEVLDIIEANSIKQNQLNWEQFKARVYKESADDKTKEDAHNTVRFALSLIKDHHSMLLPYNQVSSVLSDTFSISLDSIVFKYENGIGYIKIPPFFGNEILCKKYASQLQFAVKQLDENPVKDGLLTCVITMGVICGLCSWGLVH